MLLLNTNYPYTRKSRRRERMLRSAYYDVMKDMVRNLKNNDALAETKEVKQPKINFFMDSEGQFCLLEELAKEQIIVQSNE